MTFKTWLSDIFRDPAAELINEFPQLPDGY